MIITQFFCFRFCCSKKKENKFEMTFKKQIMKNFKYGATFEKAPSILTAATILQIPKQQVTFNKNRNDER